MFIEIVKKLLQDALTERNDLFLIDFSVVGNNEIKIIIDGDEGVRVEDCMFVSRAIEHNIDREEHDFALEVMSAGAAAPLTLSRQYPKHIGRNLGVTTNDGKFEGTLTEVNNETFTLQWKAREPKPIGKGKVTVSKTEKIAYNNVVEAKVIIKF
ncbi:ribosome assembly cofactor RimP [Olleya sp. ITB9]|uniref:ribosome assembly cofactor RimP n=1 Tax=Olleya sp. ITB9 TaxID=1715648 RepID=UPI0006CFDA1E|nr:ribosome assembly cofactor RimP [Olleya sp. ITB9]